MSETSDTRFRKGHSGNPNGRPRKGSAQDSLYKTLIAQRQTIIQNGLERDVTVEEALQLRTVQAAFEGDPKAIKMVFKWIVEREKWRALQQPRRKTEPECILIRERDSDNAFEAMCLLGISSPRPGSTRFQSATFGPGQVLDGGRVKLATWAIDAAFAHTPSLHSDSDLTSMLRTQGLHPDQFNRK